MKLIKTAPKDEQGKDLSSEFTETFDLSPLFVVPSSELPAEERNSLLLAELSSAHQEIAALRNALQVKIGEVDALQFEVAQLAERHHRLQSKGNGHGIANLMSSIVRGIPINDGNQSIILFSNKLE